MFTGIIQELGTVKEIRRVGGVYKLYVSASGVSKNAKIGDSVAVNGACLTVVKAGKDELTFDVLDESIKKTNLGKLRSGEIVNLEPALRMGDKVSGHMVSGHIDGVGLIQKIAKSRDTCAIRVGIPADFRRFIVPKGSIAVDGVSLTVGQVGSGWFSVYVIPHTLKSTRLGLVKIKDPVNIELDLMAKYAEAAFSKGEGVTENLLKANGFI